jgi:hypothetical protein
MNRVFMLGVCAALFAAQALASCGSSSCPIELHALDTFAPGRFTLDLSFQYIDQDEPRIGSHKARVGEIPSDHDEVRTINRITSLRFDYRINNRFQIGLTTPFVSRSHEHIAQPENVMERWNFSAVGDVVMQGRARVTPEIWVSAGVKLATGARHESNGQEEAEVTIQPGNGSTDFIAGATWQHSIIRNTQLAGEMGHATALPLFVSASYRINGRGTHEYRRGNELLINAGGEYPITRRLNAAVQLNARWLERDSPGLTGEDPGLTGGRFLYVSPGFDLALRRGASLYGFVQLPALQHVNGIQLTSKANWVVGIRQSL